MVAVGVDVARQTRTELDGTKLQHLTVDCGTDGQEHLSPSLFERFDL